MFLSRVSGNLDKRSRILVVQCHVLSLIDYCIRIWSTTNLSIISKVQKLQKFTAKEAIGGVKKFNYVTPKIQELGWIKNKENHKADTCSIVFKILNGYYPDWYKKFLTVREVTNSSTRQQNCLYAPKTRTDTLDRSLDVMGPKMWNSLPPHVTRATTLPVFKS